MKSLLVKFIKLNAFQPLWEKLHRISLIGMNFWGGCEILESGEVEVIKRIYKVALKEKNEIVIFDVGSNVGQYLQQLSFNAPNNLNIKIHCFEPSKKTYEKLAGFKNKKENISIIYNNYGLSDSLEKKSLYSSSETATISSLYNLRNTVSEFKEEFIQQIELSTIDQYCDENNINSIFFLKIDIEGHEKSALLGASNMLAKNKINFIQFEFGNCNIDSKTYMRDFFDILSANYNIYRLLPFGQRLIKYYSEDLEIFATSNFLAELKNK
jgi:FkbM family methyltransferase